MSSKFARLFGFALPALLVATMAAGCSSSNTPQSASPSGTEASPAASGSSSPATTEAPKDIVTLTSIFPGDPPKGLDTVLAAINDKLEKDIGVKLELTWAPWDQYANKIALGIAAGEKIDFIWSGSSDLSSFAAKKMIAPIDDVMAEYGKPIYDNIDAKLFDSMKIDGHLMGIPSTGNGPLTDVNHSLLYREDLRQKYNLPELNSIDNMEQYFKTIKENEPSVVPLTSTNVAYIIQKWFGPEDFLGGTNGAVAYKVNDDQSVTAMPIQDAEAYKGSIAKTREWFEDGYIPTDILNIGDVQAKLRAGATAAINGSALAAAEQQASIAASIPGAVLADLPVFGQQKYISGNGGNALFVTSTSKHPDKVVQFWSWVYASQENYDLYTYGIEGQNYEIKDGRVSYLNDDFTTFPGWMFKNMNYYRFPEGVTDDYIELIKNWDQGSEISPLMGFSFNPENVKTELAQLNTVFSAYSTSFTSGSVETDKLWPEFTSKLEAAGQKAVVEEAQKQIDAFLQSKK